MQHSVFVPNGDSRRDTAILLTGTAEEYKISQRAIKSSTTGFFITEELADIIYDGAETEDTDGASAESTETPDEAPAKTGKNSKKGK